MHFHGLMRGMVNLVVASGVLVATAGAAAEKEVVGIWTLSFDPGNGAHTPTLTVTKEESGLVGKFDDGTEKLDVTDVRFQDGKLTFTTETKRDDGKATATAVDGGPLADRFQDRHPAGRTVVSHAG